MKKTFLFSSIAAISAVIGNGAMAVAPTDISESSGIITISDGSNDYKTYNQLAIDTAINTAISGVTGALGTTAATNISSTFIKDTSEGADPLNTQIGNWATANATNVATVGQTFDVFNEKLTEVQGDINTALAGKANSVDVYTKAEIDAAMADYSTTAEVTTALTNKWNEAEAWIGQELGYDTTTTDAATKLNEAGFAATDFLGAVTENKNAISTKQDAITDSNKLSASLVDGLATVATSGNASDLNNDAGFITKDVNDLTNYTTTAGMNTAINTAVGALQTQAETIFAEKQTWVDNTLGITSADPNAVNNEYASTNYLTGATTLTGADIALDNAISTKQDALTAEQLAAADSGIDATKVGQYDDLLTTVGTYGDIVTHNAGEFQTALNSTQMAAVNSGITSSKLNTINSNITNLQNQKANLSGGNTFIGDQIINGSLQTTSSANVGSLTSSNGLTVQNGGLTVQNGGLTVNTGGLTVTNGDLHVTNGQITSNGLNAGNGNITTGGNISGAAISGTTGTYTGLLTSEGLNAGNGNITTAGNISGAAISGTTGTFSGMLTSEGLNAGNGNITTTGNVSGANIHATSGVSAQSGYFETGLMAGAAIIGGNLTTGSLNIGSTGKGINATGAANLASVTFNGTDSVNAVDTGENALTAGNANTIATTATVFNEIGDRATLSDTNGNLTAGQTIVAGLNALDNAIGNRNFAGLNTTSGTLTDAVNSLDTEIGADTDYATTFNGINAGNSVKNNINTLNETVGDISALAQFAADASTGNAVTNGGDNVPTTIVGAINNIDATLGQIHGLKSGNSHLQAASNLATGTTVEQHLVALDDAIGDRTNYTNQYNITNGQAIAASLDALDSTIGNVNNVTNTNNNITGETIAAKLETVDTNMGDLAALTHGAFGGTTTDITTAMNTLAENVENATGGAFAANGSWSGNIDNTGVVDYTYGTSADSVMDAVNQVASNVGTTATASKGNIIATNTVNQNLDMIDTAIGNRATIHSSNLAINDSVRNHDLTRAMETTGNLIGNMDFDGTRYVAHMTNLTDAVRTLDNNIARVENKLEKAEYNLKSGLAAMSALSALVPNARDCGDTQLSVGTGVYADRVGVAFGGFHYINDHVLFNAGASYGGTRDWAFRAGVTFGL